MGCHPAVVLWVAASRISAKQTAAFLCSSYQAFSPSVSLVQIVQPYSSTATTWKNSCIKSSAISNSYMVENLIIVVHVFPMYLLASLSVNEILLPRCVNWSINFKELPFSMEMVPSCLKYINSVLSDFMQKPIPVAACSRLYSKDSTWVGVLREELDHLRSLHSYWFLLDIFCLLAFCTRPFCFVRSDGVRCM